MAIGLLPAEGQAKRISPLPMSKELYPIGFHSLPETPIGDVIQAAINAGFRVEAEVFPQGCYIDIGAPKP